jgi:vitamin B12 transporter
LEPRQGRSRFQFGAPDTPDYQKSTNWIGYAGLNFALFDGRLQEPHRLYARPDRSRQLRSEPCTSGDDKTFDSRGRNEHVEYQGTLAIVPGWTPSSAPSMSIRRFRADLAAIPDRSPIAAHVSIDSVYGRSTARSRAGLTLTGGVRHDDHQTSMAARPLFSGGGVWAIGRHTVVRASYGEGFKAPTLVPVVQRVRESRPAARAGARLGRRHAADARRTATSRYRRPMVRSRTTII